MSKEHMPQSQDSPKPQADQLDSPKEECLSTDRYHLCHVHRGATGRPRGIGNWLNLTHILLNSPASSLDDSAIDYIIQKLR